MKFFWFDDNVIQSYLKAKFQNPGLSEYDFGNDLYKKLYKINLGFSQKPWGVLQDRTNHVQHPLNVVTQNTYRYRNETRSFAQICLDTAEKIVSRTDKPIAVFWSGGIDSTTALVAMLQIAAARDIVVVCNEWSIQEFPSFYQKKIQNRLQVCSPTDLHRNYENYFTITGDGGDTVWAVIDQSFWQASQSHIRRPWKDVIDVSKINDLDFVEEFCSWSGVPIKSWLDLRTWFYLNCKWQDKCMRPYFLRHNMNPNNIVSFYDIDDAFQCWTMNNLDQIIGNTWESYKLPAKKFIYQYHDDIDYLRTKSKVDSVLTPYLMTKSNLNSFKRIAVAEDFSGPSLPNWPFIDYADIEDFNDIHELIPKIWLD